MQKEILAAQREIIQGYYIRIFQQRPDLETILQWLESDLTFLSQGDAIETVKDIITKRKTPPQEGGNYMEQITKFDFGRALSLMLAGIAVQRTGWHGSGLCLKAQVPDEHSKMTQPYIYMEYPADHETYPGARVPWLCSITDFLSEDYVIHGERPEGTFAVKEFSIANAIKKLKEGVPVTRPQWHGKNMYLRLMPESSIKLPHVLLVLPDGKRVPWVPSQTDIFAEDWIETYNLGTKTFGEYYVGVNFNPSGLPEVADCKLGFASEIDRLDRVIKDSSSFIKAELATDAKKQTLLAQMLSVKAITWED
jgi:Protein of unknown function (DUF2829)